MKPDKHIKQEFVYRFEFDFSDSKNKDGFEKEDAFHLWIYQQNNKEKGFYVKSFSGGPAHYPYVEARGEDYTQVRLFAGDVRRKLKGKRSIHFEED